MEEPNNIGFKVVEVVDYLTKDKHGNIAQQSAESMEVHGPIIL